MDATPSTDRSNAISLPRGDHAGPRSPSPLFVSRLTWLPSASMTWISPESIDSYATYAIRRPSGDHDGSPP
ncbi:MAG: hypothetical protein ACJ74D_10800 [Gaiellaceae bacterium]